MSTAKIHWKGRALLDPLRPYSTGEVAELFGVHPKTVTRWVIAGKLKPFQTLGGHRRFPVSDVIALFGEMGRPIPEDLNR